MSECTTCGNYCDDIHIVFIDEYYRTYSMLCGKCYVEFTKDWKKNHDVPFLEYDYRRSQYVTN